MLIRWEPRQPGLPPVGLMGWEEMPEAIAIDDEHAAPLFIAPDFEVKETAGAFLFKGDLPGVQEKDLEVTVMPGRLTIAGKRYEEKGEGEEALILREFAYGEFSRTFELPEIADLDHVTATLEAGVLTVAVAKKPEAKPREVPIGKAKKESSEPEGLALGPPP